MLKTLKLINKKKSLSIAGWFFCVLSCSPTDMPLPDVVDMSSGDDMNDMVDAARDSAPDLPDMSHGMDMEHDAQSPYTEQLEVIEIVEQAYLATCTLYERCYPNRLQSVYRNVESCMRSHSRGDVLRAEVARLNISRSQAEACLEAWESADCLDVSFRGELYNKPECVFKGKQKVGESCRYNASCESGYCDHSATFPLYLLCKERECLPETKAGDPCTERNYCPPGLYCQNVASDGINRCLPLIEPYGTDCRTVDLMRPSCPDAFYCHEDTGECLPKPLEGESCSPYNPIIPCMYASQLSCDEDTNTCVKVPDEEWFIPDGGGCAFQQDMCLHDSYCKDNLYCTPILKPGDACEEEFDCGHGLFCDENKQCKYRNYKDECRLLEQYEKG